jgi:phosphoribosylanthranilate isomerase
MSGWVKVCGVTTAADAIMVADAGADAIGLNLWPKSPRYVELEAAVRLATAVRGRVEIVLLTVDLDPEDLRRARTAIEPDWLQLHGHAPDALVEALQPRAFRAIGLAGEGDVSVALHVPGERVLVDARDDVLHGGTGRTAPWDLAARVCAARPTVLAGGLGPENVAEAIRVCRPFGVDAASRLESAPGTKDAERVRRFVTAARVAFEELGDV